MEKLPDRYIENVALSLVREYLGNKGLEATLRCMNLELPKRTMYLQKRKDLAEKLGVKELIGTSESCIWTILEIVVFKILNRNDIVMTENLSLTESKEIFVCNGNKQVSKKSENIIRDRNLLKLNYSNTSNISREYYSDKNIIHQNCTDSNRMLKIPCGCLQLNRKKKLRKLQPSFDAIKFFLNSVSKGCSRSNEKEDHLSASSSDYHYHIPPQHHHGSFHQGSSSSSYESLDYLDSGGDSGVTAHPKSYPKQHVQKPLRDREEVLMSSLRRSPDYERDDNSIRLGPNKMNTFQCLKEETDWSTNNTNCIKEQTDLNNFSVVDGSPEMKENLGSLQINILNCDKIPSIFHSETPSSEINSFSEPQIDLVCSQRTVTPQDNIALMSDSKTQNISYCDNLDEIEHSGEKIYHLNTNENDSISEKCTCDNTKTKMSEECSVELPTESLTFNSLEEKKVSFDESLNNIRIIDDIDDKLSIRLNKSLKMEKVNKKDNFLAVIKKKTEKLMNKNDYHNEENYIVSDKQVRLNKKTIKILKKLVLGTENSSVPSQWLGQNFFFNKNRKLRYGLVQNKGGPCGVLATVQAFLIKALLFEPETATACPQPFCPTTRELNTGLVFALSDILWQAGQKHSAVLVRYNELDEGETESNKDEFGCFSCQRYKTPSSLRLAVEENITQLTSPNGNGCLMFVISAILSAGIKKVLSDMDEENCPLIGQNGFCTLELVTLLLTGHAVSNVFDNKVHLGSYLLQGVPKRSDIGFLSIHEHFNTCQVGTNLKTPKYPIWVVNSENHFTVVFSDDIKLTSDWRAERQFCVYHYDSMLHSSEEVKLTIDTRGLYEKCRTEGEYIPPLELCLRTKWKDASITWNGTKPSY